MQTKGPVVVGAAVWWAKLVEWECPELFRGTVLRCKQASWPYESVVDFMLVDRSDSPSGLSIMVATGYKAGLTLVHPPAEANPAAGVVALSTDWVVRNWEKWIYPECPVAQVHVIENYPSQIEIQGAPPAISRNLRLE